MLSHHKAYQVESFDLALLTSDFKKSGVLCILDLMAGGRPTKFKEEYIEQAEKLSRLGATDAVIADFFNVTETTVNNWKITNPEFFESLKRGKLEADIEITNSLYTKAKGYDKEVKRYTDKGEPYTQTQHYPPDTTACIFWLKNRQPDQWRDKQEVEHSTLPVIEFKPKSGKELANGKLPNN